MSEELSTIIEFSTDIEDAERPPLLPSGEYRADIHSVEVKEAQLSGNKYAAVTCYVGPDEYPADFDADAAPDGLTLIYRRVPLEDDAMSKHRLKKFIKNIGAPMPGKSLDVLSWVGLDCRVRIKHSEWEGEMREEVDAILEA